jgi:hypothetical protein
MKSSTNLILEVKKVFPTPLPIYCLLFVFLVSSCGQKEEVFDPSKESIFDQFVGDSMVYLTIETDFDQLFKNKAEGEYQPASLVALQSDGNEVKKDIRVSARGVTRRKICEFPPLKFWFSKEELISEDLQDFHTLKLVTHCSDSLGNEQLLLKEYLAYRLLNLLTDYSFHVQLARVKYVDSSNSYPSQEKYAFLIENNKEMAARLQGDLLDADEYQLKAINKENYNLLAIFQYMIGNTDWNMFRHHNIKLVLPHNEEIPMAVPYDFDYSGLVNAPYAVPYASLPIKHVRERFLQWKGKDVAELEGTIQLFLDKKEEILATCKSFSALEKEAREDITGYLESFFSLLENPENLAKELKQM